MTYIIKCNNDWVLFRNVPSNYTRFDYDKKGHTSSAGKILSVVSCYRAILGHCWRR